MGPQNVLELHREAMALAEKADELARDNEAERAREMLLQAFVKETAAAHAAHALNHRRDLEPTRSVLFRSAASLAIECSEYNQAESLILLGLDGNPPEEIRLELRALMPAVAASKKLRESELRHRTSSKDRLAS